MQGSLGEIGTGVARGRRRHRPAAERPPALVRARDRRLGRRPRRRLRGGPLMLTNAAHRAAARRRARGLGGAAAARGDGGSRASSSRSPRSRCGSWRSPASTSTRRRCRTRPQREWFGDLGVSYHVGFYGFSLWLAGLTVVVGAAAIGFGAWVGRDRPRAYYGLMLFLVGAVVGVFASQDLLLFYVFFEAMLIPIYVLVGVWGGPNRISRDGHVRHLHDGGLAADARLDRRLRALAGHVQPDRLGHERQRLGLPRLPGRVRGQGAAAAVPRLAAHRLHRGAARGGRAALGRRLEGRRLRARLDRAAATSRGRSTTGARSCSCSPRPGSSTARCSRSGSRTCAASIAYSSMAPDGPDRARHLRRERPRPRRRGPPLGQPRPRLGGDVPARRDADPAHRHRPVRRPRRAGEGPAGARDRRDGRRHADARRARLGELRRRVRDPRRRLRAGLGLRRRRRGGDRARRDVHAAADLGRAPPRAAASAVREESLDLRFGELALVVPLVAILLALSVWPAAISEHSFPSDRPGDVRSEATP